MKILIGALAAVFVVYFKLPAALPTEQVTWSDQQQAGDQAFPNHLAPAERKIVPQRTDLSMPAVPVSAASGLVVDWTSGGVLWSKEADVARPIASITKLMTALVWAEHHPDWEAAVTILAADQRPGGRAVLATGETVTVRDLLSLSLIGSVNSAAAALARSTGLTEAEFTTAMNQMAERLGMTTAKFVEPTGLDEGNVASAEDVSQLLRAVLQNPLLAEVLGQANYAFQTADGASREVDSTNWLLTHFYRPEYMVIGGKTGYVTDAGYCFAVTVERSGQRVLSVMLGSDSVDHRFTDTLTALDWVYDNYLWAPLAL